ncbi:proliferating cell nuclear antigen [Tulasnella sp. 417]|nr:proliferating cell nuclear antigen [Tulasnella sp. 417]
MIEAKIKSPVVLKKFLDAINEHVSEANFDCDEDGLKLRTMANNFVVVVAADINAESLLEYRCDRSATLGVNFASLTNLIKSAKDDDTVTLRHTDNGDVLHLIHEAKNMGGLAEYDVKLVHINTEELRVPDMDYDATVELSSAEFQKIEGDLNDIGESVRIRVTQEGVCFTSESESASRSILLKQSGGGKIESVKKKSGVKQKDTADEGADDGKKAMEGEATIHMNQHVNLTFTLRYLVSIAQSGSISKNVNLKLGNDLPLQAYYSLPISPITVSRGTSRWAKLHLRMRNNLSTMGELRQAQF